LRIYLDACCLSRLTNNHSKARVRAEADAVERIMRMVRKGMSEWVSSLSSVSRCVANQIGSGVAMPKSFFHLPVKSSFPSDLKPTEPGTPRSAVSVDALHLACAERGGVDVFLTTDEDFERLALAILKRELGLDGLVRFRRLNRATDGDYTRHRHRWLGGATIQEIMTEVESRRDPAP
jgi:predicted nucleic acid-binding protein